MKTKTKTDYRSNIVALAYISESEISMVFPAYRWDWVQSKPSLMNRILFEFGLDTTQNYEIQENLTHRNRTGKIVQCNRFVGQERLDDTWLNSGYASREAKDKAKNSKILTDLYRMKNLTEDTQSALEQRDKYFVLDEDFEN